MATPVTTNLLWGPVTVWYAPDGETLPADSVAAGTIWGGNWAQVGHTKDSLKATYAREDVDMMVQGQLTAIDRHATSENLTLETVLAELTATYLALGIEGTATSTAAGVSQVGKDELVAGGTAILTKRAWGFEGLYRSTAGTAYPARVFIYRATAVINGELEFGRESDYVGIPLQVKALADPVKPAGQRLFKIQRVTAPITG